MALVETYRRAGSGRRDRSRSRTGCSCRQARRAGARACGTGGAGATGLAALLSRAEPAPKGLYIFGSVGRGKTMLMDLFFETTTYRYKRRAHFHEFMAEVHDRIAEARKSHPGDPIPQVAAAIADKTAVLCFDEMHITDIADAMIVGRLFKALFESQVVVVTTSNVHPRDLYKNGLNRPLFLPFIDLIQSHMDVEELAAAKDFRLEKLAGKPLYFTPADASAKSRDGSHLVRNSPAVSRARRWRSTSRAARCGCRRPRWAWRASRSTSCAGSRSGTIDYLALAHKFHTLMIDGIPVLTRRDVARRFINLIDTLYDTRTGLVVSAEAEPDGLYPVGDVRYLFERTVSRLIEMRSESYLAGAQRAIGRTGAGLATQSELLRHSSYRFPSPLRGGLRVRVSCDRCCSRTRRFAPPSPQGGGKRAGVRVDGAGIQIHLPHRPEPAHQPLQLPAVVVIVHFQAVAVGGDDAADARAVARASASMSRNRRARCGSRCPATMRLAIIWPW